jgi:large subunit ribosomal protein L9
MRVILTQIFPNLGEVGDVCFVSSGYGRNYLLPQGMAVAATSGALRQVEDLKRTEARRLESQRGSVEMMAARIEKVPLTFTAKVGETGRLYGAITSSDIAERLEEALGEPIDRRKIVLDEPIKSLGLHEVALHLMAGVNATVHVNVVADEELMEDIGLTSESQMDEEPAAGGAEDLATDGEAAEDLATTAEAAEDFATAVEDDDDSEEGDG